MADDRQGKDFLVGRPYGGDFVTFYGNSDAVVCSGLPPYHKVVEKADIFAVERITAGGVSTSYSPAVCSVSRNVITVAGAAFLPTDTLIVYTSVFVRGIFGQTRVVTDSAIGISAGVWLSQGDVFVVGKDPFVLIGWDFTANDSTGVEMRILGGPTDSPVPTRVVGTDSEGVVSIADTEKRALVFTVGDLYPCLQIQTRAAAVGAVVGTITVDVDSGSSSYL